MNQLVDANDLNEKFIMKAPARNLNFINLKSGLNFLKKTLFSKKESAVNSWKIFKLE